MSRPQKFDPPRLTEGGLTGRVYCVTVGRDLGEGQIEATTKYDVTDQFEMLAKLRAARGALDGLRAAREDTTWTREDAAFVCPACGARMPSPLTLCSGSFLDDDHPANVKPVPAGSADRTSAPNVGREDTA